MLRVFQPGAIDVAPTDTPNALHLLWDPQQKWARKASHAARGWRFDWSRFASNLDDSDTDDDGLAPNDSAAGDGSEGDRPDTGLAEPCDDVASVASDAPIDGDAAVEAIIGDAALGDIAAELEAELAPMAGAASSGDDADLDEIFGECAASLVPVDQLASGGEGSDSHSVALDPAAPAAVVVAEALAPPLAPPLGGPRSSASAEYVDGGHRLAFYDRNRDFYATCGVHGARCRKTKTSNASLRNPAQGRPCGFLRAWLLRAGDFSTADEHKWMCHPSFEERQSARQSLLNDPAAAALLSHERQQRSGEGPEPEGCP